jgi:regulator of PEP synthase PpsR (kinase-PPPase family)
MDEPEKRANLYVISDATAETAERMLRAALLQFRGVSPDIRIFSLVRTEDEIDGILKQAQADQALVVYTLINAAQALLAAERAKSYGVATVDLIGHLLTRLSAFLGEQALGTPAIDRLNDQYFRRIEAVEFAVKHDDGQATQGLAEADVVLVGLSRTSKTPLSTYLAQKGCKVANVPIVLGLPLPREIDGVDQHRIFGLTIDVASLMRIRRARLKALNMPVDTDYARRDHIVRELEYARSIFAEHPEWPVIDVSQKAIEETASIVLRLMERRSRGEAIRTEVH